jgi:hypothetical protein
MIFTGLIYIFLSGITMFEDIDINDYNLYFDLHKSYFLRDCLFEEISFTLEKVPLDDESQSFTDALTIYKKLNNGILEKIEIDELIFYIQTDIADKLGIVDSELVNSVESQFYHLIVNIDYLRKVINNIGIILKYDKNINKEVKKKKKKILMTENLL